MEISEVFDTATGFIALGSIVGLILLLPLYFSQRRDVRRLRAWRDLDPDYAKENLGRSESRLDVAETALEEATGATEVRAPGVTPAGGMSAATRVTHERPALERITMERAALQPHPRWRRFVKRVSQPRVLVAIGVVALLLGGGAIFASQALLEDDGATRNEHVARVDPAEVKVAVLNGTSIFGLAGKVSSDLTSAGYQVIVTTNTEPGFGKTQVLYEPRQKPAAQKVAGDLGVKDVQEVDRASRERAEGADVVVIAGEDRA